MMTAENVANYVPVMTGGVATRKCKYFLKIGTEASSNPKQVRRLGVIQPARF